MPPRKFVGLTNLHHPSEPLGLRVRRGQTDPEEQPTPDAEASFDIQASPDGPPGDLQIAEPTPRAADPAETAPTQIPDASLERLSQSHTPAADEVYRAMYEETVEKGIRERSFSHSDLRDRLTRRSAITFARAIDELLAKGSIEALSGPMGRHGRLFRVNEPGDIETLREARGIRIDPKSRRVIPKR